MTRCKDVEKLVSSYIDGDIDEHRARAVRGHARECTTCAALLEDEGSLVSLLGQLDSPEPPETLWSGVAARLADGEREDARRSQVWLWWQNIRQHAAPALVAVAVVALAVVWLDRPAQAPAPEAEMAQAVAPGDLVRAQAGADSPSTARAAPGAMADVSFEQERRRQIAEAESAYAQAIADLRAELEAAPSPDSPLGADLARLDDAIRAARSSAAGADDPAARDDIHRLYREQIALLQDAALAGGVL